MARPADLPEPYNSLTNAAAAAAALQILLLLCGDVLERCMSMVKQLKGITATYRMTAKGPPVRHSHYVAGDRASSMSYYHSRSQQVLGCTSVADTCYSVFVWYHCRHRLCRFSLHAL